jgi:predicted transposase YdaD
MLERIVKYMEELNRDDMFVGIFNHEEDEIKLRNSYKLDGIEEGTIKEKQQVALNMKKENSSIEFISKVTGLSKEEIEKL